MRRTDFRPEGRTLSRGLCSFGVSVAALGLLASGVLSAQIRPVFTANTVDADFLFALQVASGDLDGDGDLDLLGANDQLPGEENSSILWWENNAGDGSSWTRRTIDPQFNGARDVQAADMDGDGDLDVLAAGLAADAIRWWENLSGDGLAWTEHVVVNGLDGSITTYAGDIDGDGDLDVASGATFAGGIRWFENLSGDGLSWLERGVDISYDTPRSVIVADIDGDGREDLLACSELEDQITVWFNLAGDGTLWSVQTIDASIAGPNSIRAGDIDRDGDLDVVASAGLDDTVYWWSNVDGDGRLWSRTTIDDTANLPNNVRIEDLDFDGDLDVVGTAGIDDLVRWWENLDGAGGSWMNRTVENNFEGAASITVGDIDGDGLLDLAAIATVTDDLVWWNNGSIHRSAAYLDAAVIASGSDAHDVLALDLDGDGDRDLVVASESDDTIYWYESQDTSPPSYTQRIVNSSADGVTGLWAGDIDGDGHQDLVSASADDNAVRWYENDGATPPVFFRRDLTATALGAVTVVAEDMDSDGDVDIVAGSRADDTIRWFENDGNSPPGFVERIVTAAADSVRTVRAADVNGDGHLDLISASRNDNAVRWHENDGGTPPAFFDRAISLATSGARGVAAEDFDADGDTDIVVAADLANSVIWFENNGGDPPLFTSRTISASVLGAIAVTADDLDDDGDVDILAAARDEGRIYRFESDGGSPPSFTSNILAEGASLVQTALPADVDHDGDKDVVSSTLAGFRIATYENCGGQFAAQATSTAPGTLAQGSSDDVLAIAVSHLGRADDLPLELQSLELLLEESPGDELTTNEANAIIDRLEIYRDEGDGVFDPAFDSLVGQALFLDLTDGVLSFEAGTGNPDFEVGPGESETFFVVPVLIFNAASQSVNQFAITHLAAAGGPQPTAVTSGFPTPLSLSCGESVSTPVIVASAYDLATVGTCPGPVQITISGTDPNAAVGILASASPGTFAKPSPPCDGLLLGLDSPSFVLTVTTDASGQVTLTPTLNETQCGLFLQVADLATCRVSNVQQLP